jgi:hypothetical protein
LITGDQSAVLPTPKAVIAAFLAIQRMKETEGVADRRGPLKLTDIAEGALP